VQTLHFPAYDFRTRETSGKPEIWDSWRRKWVSLTPEEWVRQHLARHLSDDMGFPSGRMAIEYSLQVHGLKKRADLVLFGADGRPHFLAECKAPSVAITPAVAEQAGRYVLSLQVPFLLLTNGIDHYFGQFRMGEGSWLWKAGIPAFEDL
jgi:hypothetical protein